MVRAERAFGHLQLAQDHRALGLETGHHGGVLGRDVVAMDHHAGGGRHASGVAQVLDRDRHAVQRSARAASRSLGIARRGIGQRTLGRQGGEALEPGIDPPDAVEQRAGEIDRAELARLQLARDVVERRVVQWCRHAAMFAAMAPPLKGDGAKESGGVKFTPPSSKMPELLFSRLEVDSRRPSALGRDLVADLLAFVQAVEACSLDRTDMDEDVLSALLRLDEAEALGGVEPLNSTSWHLDRLLSLVRALTRRTPCSLHRPRQLSEFLGIALGVSAALTGWATKARPSSQVVGPHQRITHGAA